MKNRLFRKSLRSPILKACQTRMRPSPTRAARGLALAALLLNSCYQDLETPHSHEANILSFRFMASDNDIEYDSCGIIGQDGVSLVVPAGKPLYGLIPRMELSPGARVDPPGDAARDFSRGVDYAVTSADGETTHTYHVTVLAPLDGLPPGSPTNLRALSLDGRVALSWTPPSDADFAGTLISVSGPAGLDGDASARVEQVLIGAGDSSYSFSSGAGMTAYDFSLSSVDVNGLISWSVTIRSFLLDYGAGDIPTICLDTPGGVAIDSKDSWCTGSGQGATRLTVYGSKTTGQGPARVVLGCKVKGRGNSSWKRPKKSLGIKLPSQVGILGMAKGCDFCLIGNYSDKSLIRNQLAFDLGRLASGGLASEGLASEGLASEGLAWSPESRQVHLVLNGEYQGVYLLAEKIGLAKGRLNLRPVDDKTPFADGAWIVEANARMDGDRNWQSERGQCFSLFEPSDYAHWERIRDSLQMAEDALFIEGDDQAQYAAWSRVFHMGSVIDWYLINELAKNNDAVFYSSVFLYYDPGDSLIHMGPLWDFDIAFGNINYHGNEEIEGFWVNRSAWMSRFLANQCFNRALQARWASLRPGIASLAKQGAEAAGQDLGKAAGLNFLRWPILGSYVWPNPQGYQDRTTYRSELDYLNDWLSRRVDWLDVQWGP